jgi:hypothetical protein
LFYLTNDSFCYKNTTASRARLIQSLANLPDPGKVVPLSGMRPIGIETGSQRVSGSNNLRKPAFRCEVRGAEGWSLEFRPHAIIATERSIPSPIFVAALIGIEKILRIDLDTSLREETYVHQALAKLPEQTIAFGRPTGVIINYSPDRAVRYDLKGDPIETFTEAIRGGEASLTVPPSTKDMSIRMGKALGLRKIS